MTFKRACISHLVAGAELLKEGWDVGVGVVESGEFSCERIWFLAPHELLLVTAIHTLRKTLSRCPGKEWNLSSPPPVTATEDGGPPHSSFP